MTDTETHQSHPGLTFGGVYVIRCEQPPPGEWRLMRVDGSGWLVFMRMDDSDVTYVHPPHAEGFRFVEVKDGDRPNHG